MHADSLNQKTLLSTLTPRERDVMHYVALGKPNKLIAAELGVSQRTIEAHRARVFQKLHVRNAVELVRCMWQSGEAYRRPAANQETEQSGVG